MLDVSIIVEWEQALPRRHSRSRTMLRRLVEEVGATLGARPELILCTEASALAACRTFVTEHLGADASAFVVRFVPVADGAEYYDIKNTAIAAASGDVLVFLDCDVVPEPGWLGELLRPLEDPAIEVVGGTTYVDQSTLYGRAFAVGWIFQVRSTTDEPGPLTKLATNNMAMRRATALRFPFPSMPDTSRGACQLLRNEMERRGVGMVAASAARTVHPAPEGLTGFGVRALSRGRDRLMYAPPGEARTLRGTGRRLVSDVRSTARAMHRRREDAGLTPATLPLAVAIRTAFSVLSTAGEVLTHVNRDYAVSRFRV